MVENYCPTMSDYPRFSFRLDSEDRRRIDVLARIRCRSRGEVVREAIYIYYQLKSQGQKP
ncbi:MAG: ribbon-helix-helix protein, CopG family [Micrococcales bacterium]|nr:ribbon-helix-helix protein, CopG family [Micrococcales bacterium]